MVLAWRKPAENKKTTEKMPKNTARKVTKSTEVTRPLSSSASSSSTVNSTRR